MSASSQYGAPVELTDLNNARTLGCLLVEPGSFVLDIGAADGSVAEALGARGCRVWAVEIDEAACAVAAARCERVICADVEDLDFTQEFEGVEFDVVLMLDVLEHLERPAEALQRTKEMLRPGGRVIASIPNVTHAAVRLQLLRGEWRYTDKGLLDRTHLRFFDRRGIEELFEAAGLAIVDQLRVRRAITETEISVDESALVLPIVEDLGKDRDSETYQFVLVATARAHGVVNLGSGLGERLQARVEQMEKAYRDLEVYTRKLQSDVERLELSVRACRVEVEAERNSADAWREEAEELRSVLAERMCELEERTREVNFLQRGFAVKEDYIAHLEAVVGGQGFADESLRASGEPSDASQSEGAVIADQQVPSVFPIQPNPPFLTRIAPTVRNSLAPFPVAYRVTRWVARSAYSVARRYGWRI